MFWLEPSDIAAVAVNCDDAPIDGVAPVTETEVTVGDGAVAGADEELPPPQAHRPNASAKAVMNPDDSGFIPVLSEPATKARKDSPKLLSLQGKGNNLSRSGQAA